MNQYQIYQDLKREWRWRYVAANGRIIGVSSEGYQRENDCMYSINLMKSSTYAPVYKVAN